VQRFAFILISFLLLGIRAVGQSAPGLPLRSATVSATQALDFGDFTISGTSGGTVTVNAYGSRSATGEITLLNMGSVPAQAIFEFKLCPGRTVTIIYSPTIIMSGSNSGSLTLHVGPTSYGPSGSQFTSNKGCNDIHLISVGGTLDVGSYSANPAGTYTGSFQLTFAQQ
jgi:hypothetical protein